MTFSVRAADHTGLTVTDLERSVAFFGEVLGFEVERRAELDGRFAEEVTGVPGARIVTAVLRGPGQRDQPGHRIELLRYLGPPPGARTAPRPDDRGAAHLAFTVDDMDALLAAAAPHGWHPAGSPQTMQSGPRAGTRFVYVRDGDGTTLEFIQPPGHPAAGGAAG